MKKIIKEHLFEHRTALDSVVDLADSIEKDITPKVSLEDGYKALKVALEIIDAFNK